MLAKLISPAVALVLPVTLVLPAVCVTPLANVVLPPKLTLPVFANVVLPAIVLFAPDKVTAKLLLSVVSALVTFKLSLNATVPVVFVIFTLLASTVPVSYTHLTLPTIYSV